MNIIIANLVQFQSIKNVFYDSQSNITHNIILLLQTMHPVQRQPLIG